jgi:hypothetical protein
MRECRIPQPVLIALAEFGHCDDASGEDFAGLLGVAIGVESGAAGLQ